MLERSSNILLWLEIREKAMKLVPSGVLKSQRIAVYCASKALRGASAALPFLFFKGHPIRALFVNRGYARCSIFRNSQFHLHFGGRDSACAQAS